MALGSRQGCRWCGRAALAQPRRRRVPEPAGCSARPYSEGGGASEAAGGAELLEVCWRRLFLRGGAGPLPWSAYLSGRHPGFGPLGAALRANLAAQWWDSALPLREQVFPVDAPLHGPAPRDAQGLRLLHPETLREALQGCGQGSGGSALEEVLGAAGLLRESLLPGVLAQYVSCLELVNKRLPCGLAQIGVCFHSVPESEHSVSGNEHNKNLTRIGERTTSLLAWFSSPRTSGQWLDYWLRQRLQWWRKGRDGRKNVIPHVLSVNGNLDRGVLAYLFDSLQVVENPLTAKKNSQRKVTPCRKCQKIRTPLDNVVNSSIAMFPFPHDHPDPFPMGADSTLSLAAPGTAPVVPVTHISNFSHSEVPFSCFTLLSDQQVGSGPSFSPLLLCFLELECWLSVPVTQAVVWALRTSSRLDGSCLLGWLSSLWLHSR
ncbi:DNA polymerase subunit gamma-2, mitochondrial isoform X6 [Onychostruthus taczanowskii]|uniref:DNA polymerase subunit gamma-2, mitochondrial isoform X6 n=1 Tax=Onychostruthus taczanowskii TaxID=356909 RepID=UPI001B7FF5F7|nr:DNA polymerase subunit gamma-2, mitochondrial isoform X6 [Onychostruthus taczanowskii]